MFRHLPHLSLMSHPIPVPQTSLHLDSPWVRRGWELRASGLCSRCFANWAISLDSLESIFSKSWKRKSYQLSSRDSQSNDDPSTSNFISFLFCKLLFSLSPPLLFKQNLQVSTFHIPIFSNVICMEPEIGIWEIVFPVKMSSVASFR